MEAQDPAVCRPPSISLPDLLEQLPPDIVIKSFWSLLSPGRRRIYRQLNKTARQHAKQNLIQHLNLLLTNESIPALLADQQSATQHVSMLKTLSIKNSIGGQLMSSEIALLQQLMALLAQHNKHLAQLSVDFGGCRITPPLLSAALSSMAQLTHCRLTQVLIGASRPTALSALQYTPLLIHLHIQAITLPMPAAALASLAALEHLQTLELVFKAVAGAQYVLPASLPSLKHLLVHCKAPLKCIQSLVFPHSNLVSLNLWHELSYDWQVGAEFWGWVACNLTSLTSLTCIYDGPSVDDLEQLTTLHNLKVGFQIGGLDEAAEGTLAHVKMLHMSSGPYFHQSFNISDIRHAVRVFSDLEELHIELHQCSRQQLQSLEQLIKRVPRIGIHWENCTKTAQEEFGVLNVLGKWCNIVTFDMEPRFSRLHTTAVHDVVLGSWPKLEQLRLPALGSAPSEQLARLVTALPSLQTLTLAKWLPSLGDVPALVSAAQARQLPLTVEIPRASATVIDALNEGMGDVGCCTVRFASSDQFEQPRWC